MVGIHEHTLKLVLRSIESFMAILRTARAVALPDWFVGAGAIRNTVWDYLHGYAEPTPPADVDVVFFDPRDLTPARDAAAEALLHPQLPAIPWQAKKQAAVHLWYPTVFYEKVGFVIVGVVPDANGRDKPDILMARPIYDPGK